MRDSIANMVQKIKYFLTGETMMDILLVLVITLASTASFGLGRMSVVKDNREPIAILYPEKMEKAPVFQVAGSVNNTPIEAPIGKTILASKNGKKYYFTNCSGANRIKSSNRVWYANEKDAESAGLTKSATCKN